MCPGVCQWMQHHLSRSEYLGTADLSSPKLLPHSLNNIKLTWGSSLLQTTNKLCAKGSVCNRNIISLDDVSLQPLIPNHCPYPNPSPYTLLTPRLPGVLAFCGLLTNCVPRGLSVEAVSSLKKMCLSKPQPLPLPPTPPPFPY